MPRRFAGSIALLTMALALTEAVVASMCAPGMDMRTAEAADPALAEVCVNGGLHDPAPLGGESDRHCPFGTAPAAQGCVGVVTLPAHAAAVPDVLSEGAVGPPAAEPTKAPILTDALFRPPRA